MAGPLSGVGGQQQAPITNTFQPGGQSGSVSARQAEEQTPKENVVQPRNAAAADSQKSETRNQKPEFDSGAKAQEFSAGGSQERGSLLDVVV